MTEDRPDPDALLARVKEQEEKSRRGKLKIFLGASAGVGKTFAMLEAGQKLLREKRDVVVGWVETHGRQETARLLEGLERLGARKDAHRGVELAEFDLDGALARRPALILLDELAHTNAPGSRHAKRWQDAVELLDAGIDTYTTLNVQHLESLNDVVAQITGVKVQETVPDSVLEEADEVELVDIPPDELLQRLREGKVYVPEQARRAIDGFFRKGNLMALRELALRRTAERVDEQMRDYRRDHGISATWPASERLLVCVGPNPASERLIRATRRMAVGLRAQWVAVYVETPSHAKLPESDRQALADNLRLAESLGGGTVILAGADVARQLVLYAREHNVGRILAGKPTHSRWRDRLRGSLVDALVRGSGDIDVYVISGDTSRDAKQAGPPAAFRPRSPASDYASAVAVVLLTTVICWAMFPVFAATNLVMVYLLGVTFVATRSSRGPAALASVLSVAAFDFFFIPPHLTFAVADSQYLLTFAVMLLVALLISTLASRARAQADAVRQRERRTSSLYAMSRDLGAAQNVDDVGMISAKHVEEVTSAQVFVLSTGLSGHLREVGSRVQARPLNDRDEAVARWVFENRRPAGLGTDTLPAASALFLPLAGSDQSLGVLGVRPASGRPFTPDQMQLLDAFASLAAAALDRVRLLGQAQRAQVEVETERLRNSLLSSVSHDLRTPLTSITGAASSLLQAPGNLDDASRRDLLETIHEEAFRLNRLVANLLDMTRLESGALKVRKEWSPIEEVIGSALTRLASSLAGRRVETEVPDNLPLAPFDALLIEQVLVNLIENAVKYTPAGGEIVISASASPEALSVEVSDRGPGIPPGDEARVFEKFQRLEGRGRKGGVGLGLTICRGIVTAHGGTINVFKREGGGASFRFTLPIEGEPPSMAGASRSVQDAP
ncbi:MAG TPA: sensor histidine kinase KdpD [Vicinamibacteria bacterium]|nr:sensor histidine kinase KdpD [Vicinamibacteria bacterium]